MAACTWEAAVYEMVSIFRVRTLNTSVVIGGFARRQHAMPDAASSIPVSSYHFIPHRAFRFGS